MKLGGQLILKLQNINQINAILGIKLRSVGALRVLVLQEIVGGGVTKLEKRQNLKQFKLNFVHWPWY